MKKQICAALATVLAAGLLYGCGADSKANKLTIWVYPVGNFAEPALDEAGKPVSVDAAAKLAAAFEKKNRGIDVEIVYKKMGENTELATAQEDGTTPDLILDSAERLISAVNEGAVLTDITGCGWDEGKTADAQAVSERIVPGCTDRDGVMRVYPVSVSVDCMGVNRQMLETAGVGDAIGDDLTWTTDEFRSVLEAVRDAGAYMPAILAGGGVTGDQGRRMLLQNWTGEPFTDEAHTTYTFGGSSAISTLNDMLKLSDKKLLCYIETANAVDELTNFANASTAVTLCWSPENWEYYRDQVEFETKAVAFPCDGTPQLYGRVYGFAVPQNGENHDTISNAAISFINFACEDADQAPETVRLTGALPARASLGDVYADTEDAEQMQQFAALLPYLGDLYGVTPNWGAQRVAMYEMLETAFTGKGNEPPEETSEPTPAPEDTEQEADTENAEAEEPAAPALLDNVTVAVSNYEATVNAGA